MVTKKGSGKKAGSKLKIKKETLKDLGAKGNVKGGVGGQNTLKCGGGGRNAGTMFTAAPDSKVNCC